MTDRIVIEQILDRGVIIDVLPSREEFVTALLERKLRFYIGADPTANTLHLSHAKNYQLLEEFRKLGHEVIVLFGDFTAMIGDPTDKRSTRARLTHEEVMHNVQDWKEQIAPLMDFTATDNPPKVLFNSAWLNTLTMEQLIELMSLVTVQQMLERDMFEKRMQEHKPIALHEFLYPLMQGYDSVAMNVDVELCGSDQRFNALIGRTLQQKYNNNDKFVVIVNLMENPVTGELMSKSRGTGVFLNVSAADMYGQIMAQPDEMMRLLLINNTRLPLTEIDTVLAGHPRDAKMRTAFEITALLHGEQAATAAQEGFVHQFQKQQVPDDMPVIHIATTTTTAFEIVRACMDESFSNSHINRLFSQNAISVDGVVITDREQSITIDHELVVKVGKRVYFKVVA